MNNKFAARLKEAMELRRMSLSDLSVRSGVSKGSISEYLSGKYEAKQKNIYMLAQALRVDPSALLGMDELEIDTDMKSIPILNTIEAGKPVITGEHIGRYKSTEYTYLDFGLLAKDDTMIHARIGEGDTVYVDQDAEVKSGDVVVAMIKGEAEAVIRYYYRYGMKVVLRTGDPSDPECIYNPREVDVIGKVVKVLFDMK